VFPEGAFFSKPWWINFFENAGLAQFDHRIGAYLIVAGAAWKWIASRNDSGRIRASANAVVAVTFLQATLGILTLVNQVPVPLAALHQITAVALLSAAIWHAFELSRPLQAAEST
jgi:cytochrome c oxidase assembly protein subunit 15